jgi:predicted  nucleic acid-binding Zn-ribbon protein
MDEQAEPQSQAQSAADNPAPLPDIKQHETAAAAAARANAESLVAAIQRDAQGVTATKEAVEKAKGEIDQHLNSAKELVSALGQQVKAAQTSAAELSTLATSIQTANTQSAETAKQATAAIESAKQIASTASEIIGRIEGIRDEAVKTQATIAEKNEHIEGGLKHVAKVRRDVDAALEQATKSSEAAERQHQATKASAEAITALQLSAQATKEKAEGDASSVASTRKDVEEHAVATKKLADTAEATEAKVAQYEAQLSTLIEQSQSQRKQIDELLAGATDAGLASAFDRRSKKFKTPERVWQGAFVFSLLGLVGLAVWQAYSYQKLDQLPDWQQVARMLAIKVPFAAPLVWLAIHAARQASLAKRLEEEYAFKATISMSFDGYRRQMAEVGKDLAPDSPLATLCNNTLREIAASPGRVYDGQRMDPSIATSLGEVLKPTVEAGFKTLSDKLPDSKL